MSMSRLTRRALLVQVGGTALGATLLAACGSPASPSATSAPAAGPKPTTAAAGQVAPATTPAPAVVSKSGRLALPMYIPPNSPPPDVEGGKVTPPGYTKYPAKLVRSVADPPAKGGEINIITQTNGTVPSSVDENPVWQEMNKRVGATLKISITPIKDYPNLAAHPTGVWRTTVYNNKIYGVGDPFAPFFWVHWHHQELLEAAGLQPPKNIDAAVRDGPVQSRPRIR